MTLEYITEYIDKKIYKNDQIVIFTFYELRVKENLSEEETAVFLHFCKQRLINLGYKIYETGEHFILEEKERVVRSNILIIAIKDKKLNEENNEESNKKNKRRKAKRYK